MLSEHEDYTEKHSEAKQMDAYTSIAPGAGAYAL